jgi:hypothetical protein
MIEENKMQALRSAIPGRLRLDLLLDSWKRIGCIQVSNSAGLSIFFVGDVIEIAEREEIGCILAATKKPDFSIAAVIIEEIEVSAVTFKTNVALKHQQGTFVCGIDLTMRCGSKMFSIRTSVHPFQLTAFLQFKNAPTEPEYSESNYIEI